MTAKLNNPPPAKRRASIPTGQMTHVGKEPAHDDMSVLKLSFDVAPLLSVVQRHVKLTKETQEAMTRDLIEVLSGAVVQLQTTARISADPQPAPPSHDDPLLTTEQAAQLAGVSRPYMVKLIDTGAVQLHQKVGNQRRVLRSSVARWQQAERVRQAKALRQLAADLDEEMILP